MPRDPIRVRREVVDGRRVRLHSVYPDGGRWRDSATHPPLLLIHGLGCSAEVWKPAMRRLAECGLDRPVYATDMPGYGRSAGPPEALGIDDLADWTARLMDVLGIDRVHLSAHSMGCQVALALARRHPERVGGLVLVGPTEGADLVPLWRTAVGLLLDVLAEPMLYNGMLLKMYLQMGVLRYFATVRRMVEDDPAERAAAVHAPCLIVRGGQDGILPEQAARQFADLLPRGSFLPVEGSAHAVQFNAPERFTQVALAFWSRAEAEAMRDGGENGVSRGQAPLLDTLRALPVAP